MIAAILGAVSLTVGCALFLFLTHGLWLTWQAHRRKRCARRLAMPINLSVLERKDFNDGLFTLTLAHPNGRMLPGYRPGQYLTLLIEADGNRSSLKRCYSLASWQPNPACYELAIRQVSGGRVSTWLHQNMQSGSNIRVLPPRGEFTLQASSGDVALIAGGIGITPIRAMLHALLPGNGSNQGRTANASMQRGTRQPLPALPYLLHPCSRSSIPGGRIVLFYAARYFDDLL